MLRAIRVEPNIIIWSLFLPSRNARICASFAYRLDKEECEAFQVCMWVFEHGYVCWPLRGNCTASSSCPARINTALKVHQLTCNPLTENTRKLTFCIQKCQCCYSGSKMHSKFSSYKTHLVWWLFKLQFQNALTEENTWTYRKENMLQCEMCKACGHIWTH